MTGGIIQGQAGREHRILREGGSRGQGCPPRALHTHTHTHTQTHTWLVTRYGDCYMLLLQAISPYPKLIMKETGQYSEGKGVGRPVLKVYLSVDSGNLPST